MKNIWIIAATNMQILFKDKLAAVWLFLMPLVFITIFGSAFNFESDVTKYKADLGVLNLDNGYLAENLISKLDSESISVFKLDSIPEPPPTRYMVIPDSFTIHLLNKKKVALEFVNHPEANMEAGATANIALRKAYLRLLADLAELSVDEKTVSAENIKILDDRAPLLTVNKSYAGKHTIIPSGFSRAVPSNTVMFTLLIVFIYAGAIFVEERTSGILRRIKTTPIKLTELYLGKLLGVTFIGLLQNILLLGCGKLLFGIYYGSSIIALVGISLSLSMAVGAMGLCLGYIVNDEDKLIGISIALSMSMAALSGCWWPIEITPVWMQNLAGFLPSGIALQGLHQLISYGRGLEAVWLNIVKLFGFALFFSLLFSKFLTKNLAD